MSNFKVDNLVCNSINNIDILQILKELASASGLSSAAIDSIVSYTSSESTQTDEESTQTDEESNNKLTSIPEGTTLEKRIVPEIIDYTFKNDKIGSAQGLFDGVIMNSWNDAAISYFYKDSSDYVTIKVDTPFRIWRSGTHGWAAACGKLNIIKIDSDNEIDISDKHLSTSKIRDGEWELFTTNLEAGTYRFQDPHNGATRRLDSEWFVEKI